MGKTRTRLGWCFAICALALSGCYIDGDSTYAGCDYDGDCNGGDSCWTVSTSFSSGGFCSYQCSSDAQCESAFGFRGHCYQLDGVYSICYQTCDYDRDCYTSSVCAEINLGSTYDLVCVPDN